MPQETQSRYETLKQEMLLEAEQYAVANNHWVLYPLLGWEHMFTCLMCHLMLDAGIEARLAYLGVYTIQIIIALLTIRALNRKQVQPVALRLNRKVWTMFILLCLNVAMLNVAAGQPVFLFLPVLSTLSSFAFAILSIFFSKRFIPAAFMMFLSGIVIARSPQYGFLIYGFAWLLVLHVIAVVLYRKRVTHTTGIISQVGRTQKPTEEICLNPTENAG